MANMISDSIEEKYSTITLHTTNLMFESHLKNKFIVTNI